MHVHGASYQVLDRNENAAPRVSDLGWKATVLVNPNESVRILVRFTAYAGSYLLHCHNLEHEDDGMMLNVEAQGGPTAVRPESGKERNNEIHVLSTSEHGILRLSYSGSNEERSLEVFDILGRRVATDRIAADQTLTRLNVSTLRSGEYFCRIGAAVAKVAIVR
jgi:hypothetical protein